MMLAVTIPDFWVGVICGALIVFLIFYIMASFQGRQQNKDGQ